MSPAPTLHVLTVAGSFGRELAAQGEPAMVDFAGEWLASLFGENVKARSSAATPRAGTKSLSCLAAIPPRRPARDDARRILMEPIGGKIWFAGEAVHETLWGTVEGAWESGTRAAEAALRHIGALKEPEEDKPARRPRERAGAAGKRTIDGARQSDDRLVERQGQRLGAARGAARRRIRHCRRA